MASFIRYLLGVVVVLTFLPSVVDPTGMLYVVNGNTWSPTSFKIHFGTWYVCCSFNGSIRVISRKTTISI
jgi:hypothetical protein